MSSDMGSVGLLDPKISKFGSDMIRALQLAWLGLPNNGFIIAE